MGDMWQEFQDFQLVTAGRFFFCCCCCYMGHQARDIVDFRFLWLIERDPGADDRSGVVLRREIAAAL